MGGVAIKEFVGLKPKLYSILLKDSGGYKKVKRVNKSYLAKISYNKYEQVLLIKIYFKHSINTIHGNRNNNRRKQNLFVFIMKLMCYVLVLKVND